MRERANVDVCRAILWVMRLQLAGPSLQVSREIEALHSHPLARFVEGGDEVDVSDSRAAPAPADENAAPSNVGLRVTSWQ